MTYNVFGGTLNPTLPTYQPTMHSTGRDYSNCGIHRKLKSSLTLLLKDSASAICKDFLENLRGPENGSLSGCTYVCMCL